MQKHVNLVDLVKSFPTNFLLQNLASIQKSTSLIKFAHLAEKSERGSISNLSTPRLEAAKLAEAERAKAEAAERARTAVKAERARAAATDKAAGTGVRVGYDIQINDTSIEIFKNKYRFDMESNSINSLFSLFFLFFFLS